MIRTAPVILLTLAACAGPAPGEHDVHTARVLSELEAESSEEGEERGPVTLCHHAGRSGRAFPIEVDRNAVAAHVRNHGDYVIGPEVCDGRDNDCDGEVDEVDLFEDFESRPSAFDLVGDARPLKFGGDQVLSLTRVAWNSTGAAWLPETVDGASFQASFAFETGGGSGADGMTFAWLDAEDTSAIGRGGRDLGLARIGYDGYAVELDTWDNGRGRGDPNGNHVALVEADTLAVQAVDASIPTLEDTGWHQLEVVHEDGDVQVWLDGVRVIDDAVPETWERVQLGFTASTGLATNRHLLDDVTVTCP